MQMFQLTSLTKFLLLWALATSALALPRQQVGVTKIMGQDENFVADVITLPSGNKALQTSGLVQIDQLFGQPPDGVTWFYIGTAEDTDGVGSAGDTIRVTIKAQEPPLDDDYPAVDVTTTVTAGHVADTNPERAVAQQICNDLDGDANFTISWKCTVMSDYSGVFINSKLNNEFGWRTGCTPITDCFNVVTTGTTVVTTVYNEIRSVGLGTELQRSPNNPRLGILGVQGSFFQQPGGTGDLLFEALEDGGSSADMRVNGSVTPVDFRVECDPIDDKYINIIRFFGACNGIKLTNFFCKNGTLSNGIEVTIRSEGADLALLPLQSTQDVINKYAIGPAGPTGQFRLDVSQGGDGFTADYQFPQSAIIKKCGTNGTGTEDFIQFRINDNLTGSQGGNLSELEAIITGFKRTP